MSNSKSSDTKGNYTNECGEHSDAENHGTLFNDQILGLHQTNQSSDGPDTFPSGTSVNGVPSIIINPTSKKLRKRKVDMNDFVIQKKIYNECKRLKKENASLESENVFWKDQCARMEMALERRKEIVDYSKDECYGLTDMVTNLSMVLIDSNNTNENEIQLLHIIEQLGAANALLLARTVN